MRGNGNIIGHFVTVRIVVLVDATVETSGATFTTVTSTATAAKGPAEAMNARECRFVFVVSVVLVSRVQHVICLIIFILKALVYDQTMIGLESVRFANGQSAKHYLTVAIAIGRRYSRRITAALRIHGLGTWQELILVFGT